MCVNLSLPGGMVAIVSFPKIKTEFSNHLFSSQVAPVLDESLKATGKQQAVPKWRGWDAVCIVLLRGRKSTPQAMVVLLHSDNTSMEGINCIQHKIL